MNTGYDDAEAQLDEATAWEPPQEEGPVVSLQKKVPQSPSGPLKKRGRPVHRLKFHGDGGAIFGMVILNYFLTILTLGIYSFWAKVKIRQYTFSNLELRGQRFAYHGNGKELFIGALKAMGIYSLLVVVTVALSFVTKSQLPVLLIYLGVFALMPFAMVGARKYMLSRTSLFGIRFSFRGDVKTFAPMFIKSILLTMITLGIYTPYALAQIRNYMISNTYFGNQAFKSNVEGKVLLKDFIIGVLLHIPTIGLYWLWIGAKWDRYYAENTSFGKLRFRSSVTGGALFKLTIVNILMLMCSLGFAYPWVLVRTLKFNAENLVLLGDIDLDNIKQDIQKVGYVGEGMAELFDMDMGLVM